MRIVLIHGLGASPRWWRPVLPALRAYDVDFADPRRPFAVDGETALVGHSLGGLRAAQIATRRPLRKLVLVAPVGIPSGRWLATELLSTLSATRPTFMPRVAVDALRWGPLGLLRAGLEAARPRVDLTAICAPTLIVWGERDNLVPARLAEQWREAIPGSRLELIPDARHVPMIEAPLAFAEVLLDFLRDDARRGVVDGVGLAGDRHEPSVR